MADLPLACTPDAIEPAARAAHFALIDRLFQQTVEEQVRMADGFALRFPATALSDLAQFILNERRCCRFLHFELSVTPADGPLWLRLTGPNGTASFLAHELRL
jgi:hypothetical protein